MFYVKRKNYAGRWIVRVVQAALIFGIVFYGMNYLGDMFAPKVEEPVVTETVQPEVQVIVIQSEAEPVLDAVDYFRLGLDHQMSDEYYDAIDDYTRSIELNPSLAPSYLNRGVAYEQLGGNDHRAISDFTQWMTRDEMIVLSRTPIQDSTNLAIPMGEAVRFDIPLDLSDGALIRLDAVSMTEDEVDPIIVLRDPTGRSVAANDDVLRGDGSLVSMNSYIHNYEVTRDGIHTLMVSHAGGGSHGVVLVRISIDH